MTPCPFEIEIRWARGDVTLGCNVEDGGSYPTSHTHIVKIPEGLVDAGEVELLVNLR